MAKTHLIAFLHRVIVLSVLALGVGLAQTVRADAPMFQSSGGIALGGVDAVSYFTEGAPRLGSPAHSVMWKGAVWQFASRSNRERFEANPWAYAPQYGGYCAYGVSRGKTVKADPTVWELRDGKLYLIRDRTVRVLWENELPENIRAADAVWPAVLINE
jgi:hypothetical protein